MVARTAAGNPDADHHQFHPRMTFDWREYLTLSEALASMDGEAAHRSALSRAYYSVYCATRNWLLARGYILVSQRNIHRTIWNEMIFQIDPKVWSGISVESAYRARSLGNDGHRLREIRE